MAKKQARPGRTLLVFLLGMVILYGLVGLADATKEDGDRSAWKPELGLDLQGGTRITLESEGNPSRDNLEEARKIIDQRVNGSGITEAEVVTQSGNIVVEIPGPSQRDLVDTVKRTAQLRFRLVACSDFNPCQPAATDPTITTDPAPDVTTEPAEPSATGTVAPETPAASAPPEPSATPANRVAPGFGRSTTTPAAPTTAPTSEATTEPTAEATTEPTAEATTAPVDDATGAADPEAFDNTAVESVDDAIAFMNGAYTQADVDTFNSYQCLPDGTIEKAADAAADVPPVPLDDPLKPLVACQAEEAGTGDLPDTPAAKFLLSPAVIQGTDLEDAGYQIPQNQVKYAVQLEIGGEGKKAFADVSGKLTKGSDGDHFAMVLDGVVLSQPYFSTQITDGNAEISGGFTEDQARSLATSLKYGSLPIRFSANTETIGPSLAGDQLRAGMTAGAFGLGLVLLYCLLYYRGLGLVVVASLLAAAGVTFSLVLLLSETAGFVLTLPGIAGLIIAVGVTADSFIIFFERIRDEMREGKSMRVAVETGWKRAKVTRLAAQVVSLLSAAVLYIFATGAVKGFGFALGLTTLVDLAILFWFTKPMVSWLARFTFFNSGHKLSGLSPETLGIDGPSAPARGATAAPVGGKL